MSRMLWFGLGVATGVVYVSRVITFEKLQLALGDNTTLAQVKDVAADYKAQLESYKKQLAEMVENRSEKIGDVISERGQNMAEHIRGITLMDENEHTPAQPVHAHSASAPAKASEQTKAPEAKATAHTPAQGANILADHPQDNRSH